MDGSVTWERKIRVTIEDELSFILHRETRLSLEFALEEDSIQCAVLNRMLEEYRERREWLCRLEKESGTKEPNHV